MAKLINKFVDDVVRAEKDGTFRSTAGTATKEAIKRQLREVPGLGMISPRTGEDGKDISNQWNFQASSNPSVGKMLRYEKWASEGRKLSRFDPPFNRIRIETILGR